MLVVEESRFLFAYRRFTSQIASSPSASFNRPLPIRTLLPTSFHQLASSENIMLQAVNYPSISYDLVGLAARGVVTIGRETDSSIRLVRDLGSFRPF